jgi:hypothetical protein
MHHIFKESLNLICYEMDHCFVGRYAYPLEFCSKSFFNVLTPRILSVDSNELHVYQNAETIRLTQRARFKRFHPNQISKLPARFPFIKDLTIDFYSKENEHFEKRIPYFPFLEHLEVECRCLTREMIEGIERTDWLKSLSILTLRFDKTLLHDLSQCLKRLNKLYTFELLNFDYAVSNGIYIIDLEKILQDCYFPCLFHLSIYGFSLRSSATIQYFENTLVKLDLGNIDFCEGTSFLIKMKVLENLSLRLHNNVGPLNEPIDSLITNVSKVETLIELKINLRYKLVENRPTGIKEMAYLSNLKKLKKLFLHDMWFMDDDIRCISEIKSLEYLEIVNNEYLTTDCFQHLPKIPHLKICHLRDCWLHGSQFKPIPNVLIIREKVWICNHGNNFGYACKCADWSKN